MGIREQKGNPFVFHPSSGVHFLQIFFQIGHAVGLVDRDLVHTVPTNERGQAGQRLLPTPPHTHQQCMATIVFNDARDAAAVFDRIVKQDQIHHGIGFIVLLQGRVQRFSQNIHRGDLVVFVVGEAFGKVAKNQTFRGIFHVVIGDDTGFTGKPSFHGAQRNLVVLGHMLQGHQTIPVDAIGFVQPEQDEFGRTVFELFGDTGQKQK